MQLGLSLKQPIQVWLGEVLEVETITRRSHKLSIPLLSLTTPPTLQLMLVES